MFNIEYRFDPAILSDDPGEDDIQQYVTDLSRALRAEYPDANMILVSHSPEYSIAGPVTVTIYPSSRAESVRNKVNAIATQVRGYW